MKTNRLNTIPLALPDDLRKDIKLGAKETGLSQADVMRHSIRLGLPQFVEGFPRPATKLSPPPPLRMRRSSGAGTARTQTKGNCMK